MKICSMTTDRKKLVMELADILGVKPEYKGAPTFMYQIGDYKVMKDGSIEVEDGKADAAVLRDLNAKGMIDNSWDTNREVISIKLPYEGHTGQSLINLTYIIASRSKLINKSIGCMEAFEINERFIEKLMEAVPETVEDFLKTVEAVDANSTNEGVVFEPDGIILNGFPADDNPEAVKSYMDLVALVNKMALTQNRVHLDSSDVENERYSFRTWLLRLGMKGDDYKVTRKILLERLDGNSAFRTADQAEAFKEKHRVKKEEGKE